MAWGSFLVTFLFEAKINCQICISHSQLQYVIRSGTFLYGLPSWNCTLTPRSTRNRNSTRVDLTKVVYWKSLTIFAIIFILEVCLRSEYSSESKFSTWLYLIKFTFVGNGRRNLPMIRFFASDTSEVLTTDWRFSTRFL